jgi:hypothetical protein
MNPTLEWKLSNQPLADVGFAISSTVVKVVDEQMPDLGELFPFHRAWELEGHLDDTWMAAVITDAKGSQVSSVGLLKEDKLLELKEKILPLMPRSYEDLYELLGPSWFSFSRFTYVGPHKDSFACRPDVNQQLVSWLNHLVLPEIFKRNEARVLRAIPNPPRFEIQSILDALWVLECEDTCKQGTAFMLDGIGLITCQHVLGTRTEAFRPHSQSKRYSAKLLSQSEVVDLAVLQIDTSTDAKLIAGSADELRLMDHLAVAGFPNYRSGDTGVIIPGLVVGFRIVSGIRRILTNASIVAGNSGGPVIGSGNKVIGVAVTGADRMENVQETENHGIVPIDAVRHL